MIKLSVAMSTINEERFIGRCLESVKWADEIVVVEERTKDRTVEIAKKYTKNIFSFDHEDNFHINKQRAMDRCHGEWILQMDADEVVSARLAEEIKQIINMQPVALEKYENDFLSKYSLFARHQKAVEARDGKIGQDTGEYTAFFIPRLNYFLGKFIRHGGVYPDGVIRLVKRGKAHFPCKSVHEQIAIEGRVGWLKNDLHHFADETFERYMTRFNRYSDLEAEKVEGGFIKNVMINPLIDKNQGFLTLYLRHHGFLDGFPGFVWALFSSLHFPAAYLKSIEKKYVRSIS